MKRDFKVDFDGEYKGDFGRQIDWRDRHSGYAVSYTRLADGSLDYLAESVGEELDVWPVEPDRTWMCASRRGCTDERYRNIEEQIMAEGVNARHRRKALYFANLQCSTNYAHSREQEHRDNIYERNGTDEPNEVLDYDLAH